MRPRSIREKATSLTHEQKVTLIDLIKENSAIMDLSCDLVSLTKKQDAWTKVTEGFNVNYSQFEPKTVTQLKRAWEYIRNKLKKEYSDYMNKKRSSSGDCPPTPPKYDPLMESAAPLLKLELQTTDLHYDTSCRDMSWDDSLSNVLEDSNLNNIRSKLSIQTTEEDLPLVPATILLEGSRLGTPDTAPGVTTDQTSDDDVNVKEEDSSLETLPVSRPGSTHQPTIRPNSSEPPVSHPSSPEAQVSDCRPSSSIGMQTWSSAPLNSTAVRKRPRKMSLQEFGCEESTDINVHKLRLKSMRMDVKAKELQTKILEADLRNRELDSEIKRCKLENMHVEKMLLEEQRTFIPVIKSACEKFGEMADQIKDAAFLVQRATFLNFAGSK